MPPHPRHRDSPTATRNSLWKPLLINCLSCDQPSVPLGREQEARRGLSVTVEERVLSAELGPLGALLGPQHRLTVHLPDEEGGGSCTPQSAHREG